MRIDKNSKYYKQNKFSIKKSIKENIRTAFNLILSNKTEIGTAFMLFFAFVAFMLIFYLNSGKNTALKMEIWNLQKQNNDYYNELQKLQLERAELERPERIMSIAKEKMGLIESLEKKVEVIKVK